MNSDVKDIYVIKRERSRAGCLKALVLLALVLLAALAVWGLQAYRSRQAAPSEPAEPLVLPDGGPERPIEDVPMAPEGAADGIPADAPPVVASPSPDADSGRTEPPPPVVSQPPAESLPPAPPAEGDVSRAEPPTPPRQEPSAAPANLPEAQAFLDAGDYASARQAALSALEAAPGDPAIERFLSDLAMPLLASRRAMPEKVEYTVRSGDSLTKIAGKFNTPFLLIARANEIRDNRINSGQRLLLFDGKNHAFSVRVSKSANTLVLLLDGRFFKSYRVATGRGGKTPAGTSKIVEKTEHPTWFPSGRAPIPYGSEENELGTHWLALDLPGYGIHGTWKPDTIGSQSSDGCIRMLNADVEELFTILPRGTSVEIVE